MKKAIIIAVVLIGIIFLQACTDNDLVVDDYATTETTTGTESTTESVTVPQVSLLWPSDFDEVFYNNPIDQARSTWEQDPETLAMTTGQAISYINSFQRYWSTEIDAVIVRLQEVLDEYYSTVLMNAQQAWTEYMEYNATFRRGLLLTPDAGQAQWFMTAELLQQETRARAIELMDFYFRLTGEVVFVFEE